MIGLIQRVSTARVVVNALTIAEIDQGILALIGIQHNDNQQKADRLIERILSYRIFADDEGKMNCSLTDIQGALLLVPQFTLAADTTKGTRPGFSTAAGPDDAKKLFTYTVERAQAHHNIVACGQFGADMQVSLTNDGPATFWLET